MGPVTFDRSGRKIQPLSVAPWAEEPLDTDLPAVLRVLRGDFFCLPFGLNTQPHEQETHPVHGETANAQWELESLQSRGNRTSLHTSMTCSIHPARVDKIISLIEGHHAVYCEHVIRGLSGRMPVGHHAMLKFPPGPRSGRISTSPYLEAYTRPHPMELPENRGYSYLEPGQRIQTLNEVRAIIGQNTDLTCYPDRRGYEDLFVVISDPDLPFSWSAATFAEQGYIWFSLKNPRLLRQTNFWISNGGRHYPPWNGRHVDVMGIEEVTSYFDFGLHESVEPNDFNRQGYATTLTFEPDQPCRIPYIMAVARIPLGFDIVSRIDPLDDDQGVRLTAASGVSVSVPLCVPFIESSFT